MCNMLLRELLKIISVIVKDDAIITMLASIDLTQISVNPIFSLILFLLEICIKN